MATDSKVSGIGFTGFLFLLFLCLKLVGKIDWSWWWVTAPLWVPVVVVLLIMLLVLLFKTKK